MSEHKPWTIEALSPHLKRYILTHSVSNTLLAIWYFRHKYCLDPQMADSPVLSLNGKGISKSDPVKEMESFFLDLTGKMHKFNDFNIRRALEVLVNQEYLIRKPNNPTVIKYKDPLTIFDTENGLLLRFYVPLIAIKDADLRDRFDHFRNSVVKIGLRNGRNFSGNPPMFCRITYNHPFIIPTRMHITYFVSDFNPDVFNKNKNKPQSASRYFQDPEINASLSDKRLSHFHAVSVKTYEGLFGIDEGALLESFHIVFCAGESLQQQVVSHIDVAIDSQDNLMYGQQLSLNRSPNDYNGSAFMHEIYGGDSPSKISIEESEQAIKNLGIDLLGTFDIKTGNYDLGASE